MFSSRYSTIIYDAVLEKPLATLKRRITGFCLKHNISSVLDICSGTGRQCRYFSEKSLGTAGLDLDRYMIEFAAKTYRGIPFILGDAAHLPVISGSFKGVSISLALHDKDSQTRKRIIDQAKKLVGPKGYILLLDFENPWSRRSKWAYWMVAVVELFAGKEHFNHGRSFLKNGGLSGFVKKHNLIEIDRYNSEGACSSIIVTQPGGATE